MTDEVRANRPPTDAEAAAGWLRRYTAQARDLSKLSNFSDVVVAARKAGFAEAIEVLFEALGARHAFRADRTTRRRLGWYESDVVRLMLRGLIAPHLRRVGA